MKIASLCSGGKDSIFSLYKASKDNTKKTQGVFGHRNSSAISYERVCLITLDSSNKESYMFHTPAIELVKLQAKAMNLPLIYKKTKGVKEEELVDLKEAIRTAKDKYGAEGIVSGALYSKYQKSRIDAICDELGLESLSPLWQSHPIANWDEMLKAKFKVILTGVAANGLGPEWLGRELNKQAIKELQNLHNTCYVCTGGEGGEFESLVLDCPLFDKKIKIEKSRKVWDAKTQSGELVIDKASLVNK